MIETSFFKNAMTKKPSSSITLNDYFENIKTGFWEDVVYAVRADKSKKKFTPAVTISGIFDSRNAAGLKTYSGVIVMDIDQKDNDGFPDDIPKYLNLMVSDPYIYAAHRSISGNGLAVYFKIEKRPDRHKDNFDALEKYLLNTYHLFPDPSGKDLSRLRFVAYDPNILINATPTLFRSYIKKQNRFNSRKCYPHHNDDIDYIIEQIQHTNTDITSDYSDWIKVGFALISKFGAAGRSKFHAISQSYDRYDADKTDKKYSQLLKTNSNKVTISSLFWLAQRNGIKIRTSKTDQCVQYAINGKKKGIPAVDVNKMLVETYKVASTDYAKEIIKQVYDSTDPELEKEINQNEIETLEKYLQMNYKLQKNEVTGYLELNGKSITDNDSNSIYNDFRKYLTKPINHGDFERVLESKSIASYNPFLKYFEKRKHSRPKGHIKKFAKCFDQCTFDPNDFHYFLEKWLMGIIASMHGTHSVIVLVLTGNQGTGKTRFFRELLPPALQNYYAESTLEHDKDADMMMCKKLIIMDDEFGGKNKRDAKKFKELTSRDMFSIREPYGKRFYEYQRYAVLCGTSNVDQVLIDTTGNRRIIPIKINSVDYEKMSKINRDDLFLELYWKYQKDPRAFMLDKFDIENLNKKTLSAQEMTIEREGIEEFYRIPSSVEKPDYMKGGEIKEFIERHWRNARLYHKILGMELRKLGYERVILRAESGPAYYWEMRIRDKYREKEPDL